MFTFSQRCEVTGGCVVETAASEMVAARGETTEIFRSRQTRGDFAPTQWAQSAAALFTFGR